jgi:hypothetical protein
MFSGAVFFVLKSNKKKPCVFFANDDNISFTSNNLLHKPPAMASFTNPSLSVNELIAQAMSTMTSLWDEIGTSDSDRDAVKNDLKVKLSRCIAEVEQNETLIRDGKLSEIKQSLDQYNKKGTSARCPFVPVLGVHCCRVIVSCWFPSFLLFPVVLVGPVGPVVLSPVLTPFSPSPHVPSIHHNPLYAPVNVQPLQTALMLQKTTTTIEDKRANETLTDAELRTRESLSLITEEFDKAKNIHERLLTTLHALYVTLNGKNEAIPAAFATIGEFLSEQRQMALTEEIKEKTNEKNLRVECKWSTSPSQVVGCLI